MYILFMVHVISSHTHKLGLALLQVESADLYNTNRYIDKLSYCMEVVKFDYNTTDNTELKTLFANC